MGIEDNDERMYPGAASRLVPPVTAADCGKYPTLEQLVGSENAATRGATLRHGVAFAKRTVAELADECNIVPVITAYNSGLKRVTGARFFDKTGPAKLEVNVGAGWVERSTTSWTSTQIEHLPPLLVPTNQLRVVNKYGQVSNVWTV